MLAANVKQRLLILVKVYEIIHSEKGSYHFNSLKLVKREDKIFIGQL